MKMPACLSVPNVKVAIWLRWESCPDLASCDGQVFLQALSRIADIHPAAITEADSGVNAEIFGGHAKVVPVIRGNNCLRHRKLGLGQLRRMCLDRLQTYKPVVRLYPCITTSAPRTLSPLWSSHNACDIHLHLHCGSYEAYTLALCQLN